MTDKPQTTFNRRITKQELVTMIDKLEDLKKQATIDRSHLYVNGVATEAIGLLYNLLGYYYAER